MRSDILTGDIRDESLIAVLLGIQDKTDLGAVRRPAKSPCAEKNAEFERHVETRQAA